MLDRKDPLFLKLVHNLLLLRFQIHVIGRRHLPPGSVVIACNHLCHTDFRFHLKVTRHSLKFLGLRDSTPWESVNALIRLLFKLTLGFVDALLENFVVFMEKGRPMPPSAVARVLRFLRRRNYIFIMSEGRVTRDGEPHRFFRGIGYFALKAGCPIIPVALSMQKRGLLARRVLYRIGTPVPPPDGWGKTRLRSFLYTEIVNEEVNRLLELNRRAILEARGGRHPSDAPAGFRLRARQLLQGRDLRGRVLPPDARRRPTGGVADHP
jgi:1-acyl-sn-glycerol-3-phosphate acyltransferase